MKYTKWSKGFTFIELIVVFTVTIIIGTIGIASLASYGHSQEVSTTALDLKSLMQRARSLALSQVKPSACGTDLSDPSSNSTLLGYEIDFCAGNKNNATPGTVLATPTGCRNSGDYEINALCGNGVGYVLISSKTYSSNLQITTDYASYFFPVLTGSVSNGGGTVKVTGYGVTRSVVISPVGVVQ